MSEFLFDMDGTLIDSTDAIEQAWAMWGAELNLELPDPQLLHGRTAVDLVASLVPRDEVDRALARLCRIEEQPQSPLPVVPGAPKLLSSLPSDRWSIVTSATRPVALARMIASGLPMPGRMVTGDDVSRGKPEPEPFLAGRQHSGDPWPAVAFEDSIAGLISARAAGCRTIGVLGTRPSEEFDAHADALITTLEGISIEKDDDGGLIVRGVSVI